jgi:hypothetical protein
LLDILLLNLNLITQKFKNPLLKHTVNDSQVSNFLFTHITFSLERAGLVAYNTGASDIIGRFHSDFVGDNNSLIPCRMPKLVNERFYLLPGDKNVSVLGNTISPNDFVFYVTPEEWAQLLAVDEKAAGGKQLTEAEFMPLVPMLETLPQSGPDMRLRRVIIIDSDIPNLFTRPKLWHFR